MNTFHWSLLPNEIKKIIFNYNRISQQVQIKLELQDLKKMKGKKNHNKMLIELHSKSLSKYKSIILYKKQLNSIFYIDIGDNYDNYFLNYVRRILLLNYVT